MSINYSHEGVLIYIALALAAAYLVTAAVAGIMQLLSGDKPLISTLRKVYNILGWLISVSAAAAFILRWIVNASVPLQSMYDVFLMLCIFVYPISVLNGYKYGMKPDWFEGLLLFVFLFPAAFIFPYLYEPLPPALVSPLFIPHVSCYMISYVLVFLAVKSSILAQINISKTGSAGEAGDSCMGLMRYSIVLYTIALFLGSIWAHLAWGRFWGWDPKEQWSLITWLSIMLFFHLRAVLGKKSRMAYAMILFTAIFVIVTLLVVNLLPKISSVHSYAG